MATSGSGGAGGEGEGMGGQGGASASSSSTTSITVGTVGTGGTEACGPQHESATISFDGMEVASHVDALWVAPASHLDLCFMLPGDKLNVCSQQISIIPEFIFEEGTMPATAVGMLMDNPMTSEPGFTVTVADEEGLGLDGSFEGVMNDGTSSYPVSGTFTACPLATE